MMKKIKIFLSILMIVCSSIVPIKAEEKHVYDDGNYFKSNYSDVLERIATSFQERYKINILIISANDRFNEVDLPSYADQFYQEKYGNSDGIIFAFNSHHLGDYVNAYGNVSQYWDATVDLNALFGNILSAEKACIIQEVLYHLGLKIEGREESKSVVDMAKLLTNEQAKLLEEKINNTISSSNLDLALVTTQINRSNLETFADDFYDQNNYGIGINKDGLLLALNMESREWHISTAGEAIIIFTDWGIDYIGKMILPDLKEGNYDVAFNTFVDYVNKFSKNYLTTGVAYDSNNHEGLPLVIDDDISEEEIPLEKETKDPEFGKKLLVSLGVGLVIGLVISGIRYAKLKTKRTVKDAKEYVKNDSFDLTKEEDLFLYSSVKKIRKPDPDDDDYGGGSSRTKSSSRGSSTHRSSSGSRHGGGGGKF